MKVFISSVRAGLEEERDALPSFIAALGHEPLRFEDFSAKPYPSREACVKGVEEADVYLLLIGPRYGVPGDDSGFAPTHEEYNVALRRGIPRLVFRKSDAELEPAQTKFVEEIERYTTGLFRKTFGSTPDLLTKVTQALRELPTGKLEWHPLTSAPTIGWRSEWSEFSRHSFNADQSPVLEIHSVPTQTETISRRRLLALSDTMASRLRTSGAIASSVALTTGNSDQATWVNVESGNNVRRDTDHGGLMGCRIAATGAAISLSETAVG